MFPGLFQVGNLGCTPYLSFGVRCLASEWNLAWNPYIITNIAVLRARCEVDVERSRISGPMLISKT